MALQKTQILRYPLGVIDGDTDNLQITVLEYQPPGLGDFNVDGFVVNRNGKTGTQNALGYINLPIPDNLQDSNSVSWESDTLNSLQLAGLSVGSDILDTLSIENIKEKGLGTFGEVGTVLGDAFSKFENAIQDPTIKENIKNALIGKAVNVIGGNIDANSLIARTSGQVLNPNMELLFKTVILRSFNFSFSLTPRNAAEGQQVKGIINTFKRRMAAKSSASSGGGEGLFIKSPDIFQLNFKRGAETHPFLFDLKPCALTGMSVNYTGTGAYATYEDATPVKMVLNLQFRELSPVYNEDYKNEAGPGVGF